MPDPNPNPTPAPAPTPEPTPAPEPPTDPPLGPAGERALAAERDARAKAERELATERKARQDLERQSESETERLKREAEEGRQLAATATSTMQEAKLLLALNGKGLSGPKAQAAVKLLDDLEYDDGYQPTNLDDRITAAKAMYGDEVFVGATPAPAPTPTPTPEPPVSQHPAFVQGPQPLADEDEAKAMAEYMKQSFPQLADADPASAA
jgi:hypothetical protein